MAKMMFEAVRNGLSTFDQFDSFSMICCSGVGGGSGTSNGSMSPCPNAAAPSSTAATTASVFEEGGGVGSAGGCFQGSFPVSCAGSGFVSGKEMGARGRRRTSGAGSVGDSGFLSAGVASAATSCAAVFCGANSVDSAAVAVGTSSGFIGRGQLVDDLLGCLLCDGRWFLRFRRRGWRSLAAGDGQSRLEDIDALLVRCGQLVGEGAGELAHLGPALDLIQQELVLG